MLTSKRSFAIRAFYGIPVLFVLVCVILIYFTVITEVTLTPEASLWQATLHYTSLALGHAIFALVIASYYRTIATDPGSVPRDLSDSSTFKHCTICDAPKPPRCHHCSTCGRCVLKMDHHCPWVGNCVGFANYKYFFLFLVWTEIATIYVLLLLQDRLLATFFRTNSSKPLDGIALFGATVTISFAISVALLLGFHTFLLTTNRSTIEAAESWSYNSYDMGAQRNIAAVLGTVWWKKLIPIRNEFAGDGCDFPEKGGRVPGEVGLTGHESETSRLV